MNASDDEVSVGGSEPPAEPPARLPAISRRTAIRRLGILVGGAAALVAAETCGATLWGLYPSQASHFGGPLPVGRKSDFPAAMPQECELDTAGVFYRAEARTYIVHLSTQTGFLLGGGTLADALWTASIRQESDDGSYWLALYQACPHLGTTVNFLRSCRSFNCPSHGATFHCDGEYLYGPGPRSMDRFPISFEGAYVIVDTGRLNQSVGQPGPATRLLAVPGSVCIVG